MNLRLNEKQKFLVGTAIRILVSDFKIPPDKAKTLIYIVIIKELKNRGTTLEALEKVSRAERHIFIRRAANLTGEMLASDYNIKQTSVNDAISKFMKIMNEQSQLLRN